MIGEFIVLALLLSVGFYWFINFKNIKNVKDQSKPVSQMQLFVLPITQFVICSLFCLFSFALDKNNSIEETNANINEEVFGNTFSSVAEAIWGIPDQIAYNLLIDNLYEKATYIAICSFVFFVIEILLAYKRKLDYIIIEGIAIVHTICICYILYLLLQTFKFMFQQMTLGKMFGDSTNDDLGVYIILIIFLAPFHCLYHFAIKKYYSIR